MKKRVLSLMLALMLVFANIPTVVAAEGDEPVQAEPATMQAEETENTAEETTLEDDIIGDDNATDDDNTIHDDDGMDDDNATDDDNAIDGENGEADISEENNGEELALMTTAENGSSIIYTVSFGMQGHGDAIDPIEVNEGETILEPATPEATAYIFGGWYTDENCANEWDFEEDTVTGDIILYALWIPVLTDLVLSKDSGGALSEADYTYEFSVLTIYGEGLTPLAWARTKQPQMTVWL